MSSLYSVVFWASVCIGSWLEHYINFMISILNLRLGENGGEHVIGVPCTSRMFGFSLVG